jgi:hypothetical protein
MIFLILLMLLFAGFIFMTSAGLILVALLISDVIMYCGYADAYSKLTVIKTQQIIQQKQVENVVSALKVEVEKYLKHEETTLTSLTPTNVQLLLVQYPQLASAPAVVKLMDDITKLNERYYALLNREQTLIADITYYKVNAFYVGPTTLP